MGAHRPHAETRATAEQRMIIRLSPEVLRIIDDERRHIFASTGERVTRSTMLETYVWRCVHPPQETLTPCETPSEPLKVGHHRSVPASARSLRAGE